MKSFKNHIINEEFRSPKKINIDNKGIIWIATPVNLTDSKLPAIQVFIASQKNKDIVSNVFKFLRYDAHFMDEIEDELTFLTSFKNKEISDIIFQSVENYIKIYLEELSKDKKYNHLKIPEKLGILDSL